MVFTGGEDGLVKLWDSCTGRLLQSFRGHTQPVTDLVVSYDNLVLASCDQSGVCYLWEIATGQQLDEPTVLSEPIEFMEFVYPSTEPTPLEAKKGKTELTQPAKYRVFLVGNNGSAYRISLGEAGDKRVELVLGEIDEGMFNGACLTRGKRIGVLVGMSPFAILFDTDDPEGRFYVLDTDDLLTSAVDTANSSLKIVASTYSPTLFVWRYQPNVKPTKQSMQTRKTFKGRDLEGAWERTVLSVSGMSSSLYITDLVFLAHDISVAAVDSESNLRLINLEQGETVAVIKKDFKISAIAPHPVHPWVITLEINGWVKVIAETGELLQSLNTELAVGGGMVVDSTGSAIFLTDMDGGVHKYSLMGRSGFVVPASEFFQADFSFLRDINSKAEGSERVQQETAAKMSGILKVCQKNAPAHTYTMLGEAVPYLEVPWSNAHYVQVIAPEIRNQEISGILHLQLDMINNAVFEKEYRQLQHPPNTVIIPEDEEESSLSSDNELDSQDDSSSAITIASTSEEGEDSDSSQFGSSASGSAEEPAASSSTGASEVSSAVTTTPKRKLATDKNSKKPHWEIDDDSQFDFYSWLLKDTPNNYPLVPQAGDSLLFLPARLAGPRPAGWPALEPIEQLEVTAVALHPEKDALVISAKLERTHQAIVIDYSPTLGTNDPFILFRHYLDSQKKRPIGDPVTFYQDGGLTRGTLVSYGHKHPDYHVKLLIVRLNRKQTELSVLPFDIQYKPADYAADLANQLEVIGQHKTDENALFYSDVSRKHYPDYYELVGHPISLNRVLRRGRQHYYRSEAALLADLDLVLTNCLIYNEDGSDIVAIAEELIHGLKMAVKEVSGGC